MGERKDQADLSATEKRDFVHAILELKRQGRYDEFVTTHNAFIMSDTDDGERTGHRSPSFLPWHRRFLLQFERALQSITSSVSLPYWDWTKDRSPSSSLWSDTFLGGTGRAGDDRVTSGPFAFTQGSWPVNVRVDGRTFLRRNLGANVRALPTRQEVDTVLAMPTYDAPPWNSESESFRNHLEGWQGPNLHNRVHVWVGGQMLSGASPNDPVFWLHHCFIDKLWADWQAKHPSSGYVPVTAPEGVIGLRDTMKPWNDVTPQDMLDHTKFYTYR
ncbi:tyrosinase family protein [Streptomyces actinomycinicus]|uniref:Tyrosinase family protein n=1 Tax=Streptomyces actinomycinicus TaxID=1695166 RepID=A0A937EHM0_9ACTN|nr:tyrosinase family protein [Streptomyces actinomycinicus]MBL1082249.1 tyrosinase family protein [Streptomyces actinomycinicus]